MGGGLAWFFLKGNADGERGGGIFGGRLPLGGTKTEPPSTTPSGTEPTAPAGKLLQVTNKEVAAAGFDEDNKTIRYIVRENGHVFDVDTSSLSLNPKESSSSNLEGVLAAVWSPDRKTVVAQILSQGKIRHYLLSLQKGVNSRFLPDGITSLDWSPSSKELAFTRFQNNKGVISVLGLSAKTPTTLYESPVPDLRIDWIKPLELAITTPFSGFAHSPIFTLNRTTKNISTLRHPLLGLGFLFSPQADKVVISKTESDGNNLSTYIEEYSGRNIYNLPVGTQAERCAWLKNGKLVYCAVPVDPFKKPQPDSFYQGLESIKDELVEINLELVNNQILTELPFSVKSLGVNNAGDTFFFIRLDDQALWVWKK